MSEIISETKAIEIVHEFLEELKKEDKDNILALYVIGSLGGGYYRSGQSDIDTVIIVKDEYKPTQEQVDKIANKYWKKYDIPKGFGSVLMRISELSPPYIRNEEFFMTEIARLKSQGKIIFGEFDLNNIKMPTVEDFRKEMLINEKWFAKEFGYPMFDKLQITGCVNTILGCLRDYLIIEKNIFEFNKFLTIDTYLNNNPPIVAYKVFNFIKKKLRDEIKGDENDLIMLRKCGIKFRDFFNMRLLGIDSKTL